MATKPLRDTAWLAQRLSISETTIERLRAKGGSDLPPFLNIGRSIRYDTDVVESWCAKRLQAQTQIVGGAQ
jgi:predicted DNA-binding transcriptional regulator AlpA